MKTMILAMICLIGSCQFTIESKPSPRNEEPALSVISDSDLRTYNRVRRILDAKTEEESGKYRGEVYPIQRGSEPSPVRSHLMQPGETYEQWYRRVGPIIPAGD